MLQIKDTYPCAAYLIYQRRLRDHQNRMEAFHSRLED